MRLPLALVALCLAGCGTSQKDPEPPVVVQPAVSQGALKTVGEKIDLADSRVAAAVAVAIENKSDPLKVEA